MRDIMNYYQDLHQKLITEVSVILQDCDDCIYREEGLCMGGCLAHSYNHFTNEANVRFKEIYQ